jgi:hypothetical protein
MGLNDTGFERISWASNPGQARRTYRSVTHAGALSGNFRRVPLFITGAGEYPSEFVPGVVPVFPLSSWRWPNRTWSGSTSGSLVAICWRSSWIWSHKGTFFLSPAAVGFSCRDSGISSTNSPLNPPGVDIGLPWIVPLTIPPRALFKPSGASQEVFPLPLPVTIWPNNGTGYQQHPP